MLHISFSIRHITVTAPTDGFSTPDAGFSRFDVSLRLTRKRDGVQPENQPRI